MQSGQNADAEERHAAAHREFISSLIKRNAVVLGGDFSDLVEGANAAYLLSCGNVDEAESIAAADPFAVNEVVQPKCVEWQLVAVNPEAVDISDIVRPTDV